MKKLFIIICLLANIVVLGACGDVEGAGESQPRVPRVEVESENYWRSLKLPWNPILAKDSTYPIQEEWNISNAM